MKYRDRVELSLTLLDETTKVPMLGCTRDQIDYVYQLLKGCVDYLYPLEDEINIDQFKNKNRCNVDISNLPYMGLVVSLLELTVDAELDLEWSESLSSY